MLIDGIALEGWKKEPASEDDFDIEMFKSAITEQNKKSLLQRLKAAISREKSPQNIQIVDLRKYCSPVENQRVLNSCTGNAVVGALELLEIEQGMKYVDLSRLFAYYNGRLLMGDGAIVDEGTYIRTVMLSLLTHGVCSEEVWPYDIQSVNKRPVARAYRDSYGHKIKSFYRVSSTGMARVGDIKYALNCGHPVVFGAEVSHSFTRLGKSGMVAARSSSDEIVGRHAMLIVGYDQTRRVLIVRNSWGPEWGDNGYCYYTEDYLDEFGAEDFWVATMLEAPPQ